MDAKTAKTLKVGDRVIWDNNPGDRGKVVEVGYCAVKVAWENGLVGTTDFRDMRRIEREPKTE